MWTSTSMAVPESVLLSVMGLGVVMVTLITLALVILLFSKVMGSGAAATAQAAPRPIPDPPGISDEILLHDTRGHLRGASRVAGRDQRHQHQRIKVKQAHNRRL